MIRTQLHPRNRTSTPRFLFARPLFARPLFAFAVAALLAVLAACGQAPVPPSAVIQTLGSPEVGDTVVLDGSASSGASPSFSWTLLSKPAGSAAALSGGGSSSATFVPDDGGTYVVELTVSSNGMTSSDTVVIDVPHFDVAGTWSSVFAHSGTSQPVTVNLSQSGASLTGTLVASGTPFALSGSIAGTTVSLLLSESGTTIDFTLEFSATSYSGSWVATDGVSTIVGTMSGARVP